MEEYHTGWAARAAQELDEQILSSGIEPVRGHTLTTLARFLSIFDQLQGISEQSG